jgi:hypothetical protein
MVYFLVSRVKDLYYLGGECKTNMRVGDPFNTLQ